MIEIAVHGALYGDEGKGKVVSSICSSLREKRKDTVVILGTGGPQMLHTTVLPGKDERLTARQLSSGSFLGYPTYITEQRIVSYGELFGELARRGDEPELYIAPGLPLLPYISPIIAAEREKHVQHSSCGLGVGIMWSLIEHRGGYKCADVPRTGRTAKVDELAGVILEMSAQVGLTLTELERAVKASPLKDVVEFSHASLRSEVSTMNYMSRKYIKTFDFVSTLTNPEVIIYEGSQGLHLHDTNLGTLPFVAGGYFPLWSGYARDVAVVLVCRSYASRHGYGPVGTKPLDNINREDVDSTNPPDSLRGQMRYATHDVEKLNESIRYIEQMSGKKPVVVITHCDIMEFDTTVLDVDENNVFKSYVPHADPVLGTKIIKACKSMC